MNKKVNKTTETFQYTKHNLKPGINIHTTKWILKLFINPLFETFSFIHSNLFILPYLAKKVWSTVYFYNISVGRIADLKYHPWSECQ